jgi:hypothetical protein
MFKITDYNLINVASYLNNKDSYSFLLTSKYLKNLFSREGFLKSINFGYNIINTDIYDFSITCARHYNSLNSIYVSNTNNPQVWIQNIWPKIMHFNFCTITDLIDPSYISNTEELYIKQHEFINKNITLKINWVKFPYLKKLKIMAFDIDLTGIKTCNKLKHIDIYLFNKNSVVTHLYVDTSTKYISINKNKY